MDRHGAEGARYGESVQDGMARSSGPFPVLFDRPRFAGLFCDLMMKAIETAQASAKWVPFLAFLTLAAGAGGMAISFLFLASASHLDVIAGAAGFIAGSILTAAGLLSIVVLGPLPPAAGKSAQAADGLPGRAPALDVNRWLAHFQANREHRPEPAWDAPVVLAADAVRPLVRSLEQFQLGDGGGPACLIAWDAERFRSGSEGMRALVDLWFAEEREHARLLAAAVARFGGRCIRGHWSFTVFCLARKRFGVRFELTVLLLTEIVSTVYYRLLRRHGKDPALRSMCRLILRDEVGHVAFHRDRLARGGRAAYGMLWEIRFRTLGLAAASMLWLNHAAGLRALGASGTEFYRGVWHELSRFVRCLRREALTEKGRHGGEISCVSPVAGVWVCSS